MRDLQSSFYASGKPWENFFASDTNIQSDSRLNWLKLAVKGHCELTKVVFGPLKYNVNRIEGWCENHLYTPKRSQIILWKSFFLAVIQRTITQEQKERARPYFTLDWKLPTLNPWPWYRSSPIGIIIEMLIAARQAVNFTHLRLKYNVGEWCSIQRDSGFWCQCQWPDTITPPH